MSEDSKKLTEQLIEAAKNSNIDPKLIEGFLIAIKEVLGESVMDIRGMPVEEISKRYDDIRKLFNEQSDKFEGVINLEDKKLELLNQEASDLKRKIEFMVTQKELDEEQLEAARSRFKALRDAIKLEENVRASMQKGEAAAERLLQATFGISKGFGDLSKKGLIEGFAKGISQTLTFSNILVSITTKMFETMLRGDKARARLFSTAQITRDQLDVGETARAMGAIGTNLEGVAAEAASSLKQNFLSFSELTTGPDSQLEALATGMGVISKLGVDMNTQSQIIGTQVKAFGQTPEAAKDLLFNLTGVSRELGRPANEMLSDFKNAMPILARFEAEMSQKIFKDTALMSSKLGIEVNRLLQMNENMDTFEGAAKFAQSINVAFGAPIVSAQALLAAESPAEKRKLVMDSLKREGRSIGEMSEKRLRGMSFDLGFGGDVAQLKQYFNEEVDIMDEDRARLDDVAVSMQDTQALVAQQLDVGTKLMSKLEEVAGQLTDLIGGPTGLIKLTDYVVGIIDFFSDNLIVFAGLMFAMAAGKFGAGASTIATIVGTTGGIAAFNAFEGGISEREGPRMEQERMEMQQNAAPRTTPDAGGAAVSPRVQRALAKDLGGGSGGGMKFAGGSSSGSAQKTEGPGLNSSYNLNVQAQGQSRYVPKETNDGFGSPGSTQPVMARPKTANNYITPVFNKDDQFYAAKADGALAKMIKQITGIVDEIAAKKSNLKLSMSERAAGQMVADGLNAVKRL